MKLILCVLCMLAVITGSIQDIKNNVEIVEKCTKKTQATKADIEAMNSGNLQGRASQCFAACWMKEFEIMTPDNKVNVSKMNEMLDLETLKKKDADNYKKVIKILDTCAAEVTGAADECDAAKKFLECRNREDV